MDWEVISIILSLDLKAIGIVLSMLISISSLLVSAFVALRDRSRLEATAVLCPDNAVVDWPYISVSIVNTGRRPIYVHAIVGYQGKKAVFYNWMSTDSSPFLLTEGQAHRHVWKFPDLDDYAHQQACTYEDVIFLLDTEKYSKLMLEDATGKKHKIKGISKCLKEYRRLTDGRKRPS